MTLPLVIADHGSAALSIAFGLPVAIVGAGIAFMVLRDRRRQRREADGDP